MKLSSIKSDKINFRQKSFSIGNSLIAKINGPNIKLINKSTKQILKTATSDYFDQPFTSVIISDKNQKVFVSSKDGGIYVYNFNLKLIDQWFKHNWYVNDLVLSNDQKFLYSVSSDRSIIKWDINKSKIVKRFSSKSYPTYGVSYFNGQLNFGDGIGHLKSIKINSSRLLSKGTRISNYPNYYTYQLKDSSIICCGADNKIHFINNDKNSSIKLTKSGYTNVNHQLSQKIGFYKSPFSEVSAFDVSPNNNFIIYCTDISSMKFNYIKLLDVSDPNQIKYSKKLRLKDEYLANNLFFLNDSVFVSSSDNFGVNIWKISNKNINKLSVQHITLKKSKVNTFKNQIAKLNQKTIAYIYEDVLYIYNLYNQKLFSKKIENVKSIFSYINNSVILSYYTGNFSVITIDNNLIKESSDFIGHSEPITKVSFSQNEHRIFTSSTDGTIRVWDENEQKLTLTIIPVGLNQIIYLTPDNYYMMINGRLNNFGFRVKDKYYYPEQFDPIYNRPDIILDRLGYADSSLIAAYHEAYLKRLKKMGFTEDMLKDDFHLPEIKIENFEQMPTINDQGSIDINLNLKDTKYKLDRINVWVNDVAIYGTDGISLRDKDVQEYITTLTIDLAKGNIKVQLSVLNQAGAESYKETFEIECTVGKNQPDLYLITIGESKFEQSNYNLTYASKDANDVVNLFTKSKAFKNVYTKTLVNEQVTKSNILALRSFLEQADINDQVMIFIAGHGVLDVNLDYYFATYDMDFTNPSDKGIAYEDLEGLLDGIKPLKKTLIIDACHSGEIDKDEVELAQNNTAEEGDIQFRTVGNIAQPKLGVQNTSELTKLLFTDLRKGTGATVISSAGGMEFAMESADWNNGLFTYCLLKGITSGDADLNKDGEIWLSELQEYVGEQVTVLSNGKQQPTSRIENQIVDFRVW